MSAAGKGKTGRLGTQLRGKLQKDYNRRGARRYALWYVYSPKGDRDAVLHGDLRYGHFLHVESEPQIRFVDYAPQEKVNRIVGEDLGKCIDAEVHLVDGGVVWRSVRNAESADKLSASLANLRLLIAHRTHKELPVRVELWTAKEVFAQPQRIQNWNRALPYLAQAREWPLHEFGNEVAILLHTRREVFLRQVMELGDKAHQALYVAALLHGVQFGRFQSDLNEQPWSLRSRFFVAGQAS
jgi:hypothetical protein